MIGIDDACLGASVWDSRQPGRFEGWADPTNDQHRPALHRRGPRPRLRRRRRYAASSTPTPENSVIDRFADVVPFEGDALHA